MPLFTICNMSFSCPQNVSVKSTDILPKNICLVLIIMTILPQNICLVLIIMTIFAKKQLFGFDYNDYSAKKHLFCFDLIIMTIALKSCILKPHQCEHLIYGFLSAHIRSMSTESGCHMTCEY